MRLPKKFPNKKILSIDIGGTLAKTAFYVPSGHQLHLEKLGKLESLTDKTIPSKLQIEVYFILLECASLLRLSF